MDMTPDVARALTLLLERHTGQQLSGGRSWRLETALTPVLRRHDLPSLDSLTQRLRWELEGPLVVEVIDALVNNETFFYREAAAFTMLYDAIRAFAAGSDDRRLRIWCAGCSTGQEAYSLAMRFAEDEALWHDWTIEILGTDISRTAIERAREGLFTQFEIQRGLPAQQIIDWFTAEGDGWRAHPRLRQMVRFQRHNLLGPPPSILRCNIILCRNVMLYFSPQTRALAFSRLAHMLKPDGILMLGAGETIIGQDTAFLADTHYRGLYRNA